MSLFKPCFQIKRSSILFGLCIAMASFQATSFMGSDKPTRANDLAYGGVLFEYHQGNAFEALSLLHVAKEKGGIKGHGEHPDLVEGGLLLSYGLTQEAKAIFEQLLAQKLDVSDRNLAWFYLGKVFYLENQYTASLDSFQKINLPELVKEDPDKFYELIYLASQIDSYSLNKEPLLQDALRRLGLSINALPTGHIYSYYMLYNRAVAYVSDANTDSAIQTFTSLIKALSLEKQDGQWRNEKPDSPSSRVDLAMELKALYNLSLLSLGQLYLQNNLNDQAFSTLKQVDKNSVFSAKALFAFAISASNLQRHDMALSALNTLNEQALFNPWQQQTPFALAYLYEQLNEPVFALEAYRAAVAKYEKLQEDLKAERALLSQDILLNALNIKDSIGTHILIKDAYGRVKTPEAQFNFAELLTSEKFQRQLSELHELYLIKNSMHRWEKQLASFEDILDTRLLSRQQKLQSTKSDLASKAVDLWNSREQTFKHQIETAIENEDAYFFMTEEQISYFNRIQKAEKRLLTLPEGHKKKREYTRRFIRAKAYFDWWVHNEFSVNRWRAEKELKALQKEMSVFRKRFELLDSEKELDEAHLKFVERVTSGKTRLAQLKSALDNSLHESSAQLLSLVDDAMQKQLSEIDKYLLASREALARVSDDLLVSGKLGYKYTEANSAADKTPQKMEGNQ